MCVTEHSPIEVRNELVLIVTHTRPEMSDTLVRLLGPTQVRLGDEDMTHGQHTQTPQLFGGIEHHWRETTGHFGVKSNLDTSLDLNKSVSV